MKNLAVFLTITLILTGCVTRSTHSRYKLQGVRGKVGRSYSAREYLYAETSPDGSKKSIQRVVIYDATLAMTVKNPDSVNVQLRNSTEEFGGYVQTLGTRKSVIRVQADSLDSALMWLTSLGKIDERIVNGDDITEKYLDIEMRLENALQARKRYLELLERAENVEAALKVEKELERLNTEIDSYMGKKRLYDHQEEFSTITIKYSVKKKWGVLGIIGVGIYKGFKWLIIRE